jgi:cob(I)alamin adenosyltransferase
MKIYTKTGDEGLTGLLGGSRVKKTHLAIEVNGCLDETNSVIGLVLSETLVDSVRVTLTQVQNDLFDLGSRVAAWESDSSRPAEFPESRSKQLETWIDEYQAELPELKEFILPGGSPAGAMLHFARAVCRRTERQMVGLMATEAKTEFGLTNELIYLNRLGDLLFVLARVVNLKNGRGETKWVVTRS